MFDACLVLIGSWKGQKILKGRDEYPCARVSVIFPGFLHYFVLPKLATSSIRVKLFSKVSLIYVDDFS